MPKLSGGGDNVIIAKLPMASKLNRRPPECVVWRRVTLTNMRGIASTAKAAAKLGNGKIYAYTKAAFVIFCFAHKSPEFPFNRVNN
jgi:hypothetical protein